MKPDFTREAIAKRHAAASHKLMATDQFGVRSAIAYGPAQDMRKLAEIVDPAKGPKVEPNN